MILTILAVIVLVGYIGYRAAEGHAARVRRDQAEIAAWKPLGHGEPPRNLERSRWDTRRDDVDGTP